MTIASVLQIIFANLLLLWILVTILWAVSTRVKDASIIDIFWGPFCATPAVATFIFFLDDRSPRAWLLTGLAVLWAARLGIYLAQRNLGHGEDFRYVAMRKKQGSDAAFARWSLPRIFLLQATVAWFVSLPVQVGQFAGSPTLGVLSYIGAAIFAIGILFETIGDAQLKAFKSKPENKGKLMTTGLWALTRHPNYFGDACLWFGLALIALEAPFGWIGVLSPFVMAFFLVNISGKALLERSMMKKYPEYEAYRARTSGFLPLPPKSSPPTA